MFISDHDSRSAAMIYLIKNDFEKCLIYLNQLSESFWRQCTTVKAHLEFNQCKLVLKAIFNLKKFSVVQCLKNSIFIKARNYNKTFDSIHDAYNKKTRARQRKQSQRCYCFVIFFLMIDSKRLFLFFYKLRMHICNIEFE